MTFNSAVARMFKKLKDAMRGAREIQKLSVRCNADIQASNATDELKEAGTAFADACATFSTAVETFYNGLPG